MKDLTDRIDTDVTDAQKELDAAGEHDVDPNGVEAALRLRLSPAHTHFRTVPAVRVDQEGAHPDEAVLACQTVWAVPDGVWTVISFPCPDEATAGLHSVRIDGPGTEVARTHLTVDEALALMQALGVLPADS